MSFKTAFLELMSTSVVRKAFARRSGGTSGSYGAPAYSTQASTYQARVVAEPELVIDTKGQEVVATHRMWIASTAAFAPEDYLAHLGTTYRIVRVSRQTDETGRHHTKVWAKG